MWPWVAARSQANRNFARFEVTPTTRPALTKRGCPGFGGWRKIAPLFRPFRPFVQHLPGRDKLRPEPLYTEQTEFRGAEGRRAVSTAPEIPKLTRLPNGLAQDLGGERLLRVVADPVIRADVRLEAEAVGAVGHGGKRSGRDVGCLAHGMRRVDHHRGPGLLLEQWRDALVGMVAVAVDGRGRAARAEDDVRVAEGGDVLGGRDELVDRTHVDAAFEQHDVVALRDGPADRAEQRVVERVARTDLQRVHACIEREGDVLTVVRPSDHKDHRAQHGLYRALIQNMIVGVSEGFTKEMEVVGVGYRANATGQMLELALGFSHQIVFEIPKEVQCTTVTEKGKAPIVKLESHDKQLLGAVAAKIRSFRKPEPYKGKGIRFVNEVIRRKAGKSASSKK